MTEFEYLTKQLAERTNQLTEALAEGAVKSFDEYKQLVGEIRGLSFAQLSINDLVRKLEKAEDE